MDIGNLERRIFEISEIKNPDERLKSAHEIFNSVRDAESECARDFQIPFDSVRRLRKLIPEIEGIVNRLEAGARRRGK